MVQSCWIWLVWTSTWQLGWKVGSTIRCRVVLPEVRHWKLVESYRLQTLRECRERRRGYPAVVHSGKNAVLEKTLAGMGDDEPILAGKKVLEKELEKLQKKLNGPKKNGKAHRGQTKLDQQRIQTIAREPQSTKRNIESGLRGDQDSQRRPAERGRNDGQKQEPLVSGRHGGNPEARTARIGVLERVGIEETSWLDTRRFVGGNRWLDAGSSETQQRSRSKEEQNCKRRSRGNQGKIPKLGTMPWMVWIVLCRHEGANTDIASNIRV